MTQNLPTTHQANNYAPGMPSQQEFQMLQVIAKNAQSSGLYAGIGQEAKIFMVLLAARELGISPMLALNGGIWNINGKVEISARLMNGLIRRAGHSIKIIVSNDNECKLLGTRTDGDSFECSFTMEDASKAGLAGSNVWKKYPADMLYNRCMSRLARRLFSDVIGTAYVEGELKELKEGNENEKRLPLADYEVHVSSSQESENKVNKDDTNLYHKKDDTNLFQEEVNLVNQEQLKEIIEGLAKIDEESLKNYHQYMETRWSVKAGEYHKLPERAYKTTMQAVRNNIEKNKKQVA